MYLDYSSSDSILGCSEFLSYKTELRNRFIKMISHFQLLTRNINYSIELFTRLCKILNSTSSY